MPAAGRRAQPRALLRRLQDMRVRLAAIAAVSLIAGCGTAAVQAGGSSAASSAASSAGPAATGSATAAASAPGPASASAPGTGAATASPNAACPGAPVQFAQPGTLTGLEFVSAAQGWSVGLDTILATTDGGAHWQAQLTGKLGLTSVDFVNGRDGWAVGTTSVLATSDGGAHWTPLPDPCPLIRSVHFISPTTGVAVAGGGNLSDPGFGPETPGTGGIVLSTSDGGRTWHRLAAPANAQTVCFSDAGHGWLGAAGRLYRSADGGMHWTGPLTPETAGTQAGYTATMAVECAGDGSAWALRVGPGAGMSQNPHVGYHADQAVVTPVFAEQYFQGPGGKPVAPSPGSEAGPFSALSPSAAVFIDYCPACGPGTAPWDVAADSGATLVREGNVGAVNEPQAASFLSAEAGWVAGTASEYAKGKTREQSRIVATADGGRTWHLKYAGPWTAWTG
jgi:photosystem II stability/assembly factor-like uncharacterized protein